MKKLAPWLLIPSLLLLAGAGCTGSSAPSATSPAAPAAQGKAIFMVTDDAPSLAGVTAVVITVSKVETHSAGAGWQTVSTSANQYDLMRLKQAGTSQLLADVNLDAGTYDQMRLDVSKVNVTVNGKTVTARLPSNTLTLVGGLTVASGKTSTASLDFQLDKSLHLTGKGVYILAPVVRLQTKNDVNVDIKADGTVDENGGRMETDKTQGMDEKGEVKADFELPEKLDIDANGLIKLGAK